MIEANLECDVDKKEQTNIYYLSVIVFRLCKKISVKKEQMNIGRSWIKTSLCGSSQKDRSYLT